MTTSHVGFRLRGCLRRIQLLAFVLIYVCAMEGFCREYIGTSRIGGPFLMVHILKISVFAFVATRLLKCRLRVLERRGSRACIFPSDPPPCLKKLRWQLRVDLVLRAQCVGTPPLSFTWSAHLQMIPETLSPKAPEP